MNDLRELLRGNPQSKSDASRLTVLKAIMAKPGTQAELARRSGLAEATVSGIVAPLKEAGIVTAVKDGSRNIVTMASTSGVAVGVELGFQRSAIVARRVDQEYGDAVRETLSEGAAKGAQSWLDPLVNGIRDAVAQVGDPDDELVTIGLGVPRMVDPRDHKLTPPLLPPWRAHEQNPASLITDALRANAPVPENVPDVRMDNDANLGALAESTYMHVGKETLVYVKASTGIGAGIVIGGKLFRGRLGIAGELGHTVVDPDGRYCQCGGRGCLETIVGADALLEHVRATLGKRRFSSPADLEKLVSMAEADAVCQRVLRDAAERLGLALGSLCNLLSPDVIVLGGGLGAAGDLVVEPCRSALQRTAMAAIHADETGFQLVTSQIPHATAHGALLLGIQGTTY